MHKSMVVGVHFLCFRLEIPYVSKFGSKNQNCQSKLTFGTQANSNMHCSMVIFLFSVSNQKYSFLAKFHKLIITSLSWNLIPRLIRICRIQWWCSLFLTRSILFQANLFHKNKIVCLEPRLIRIRRIWYCFSSFFPFSIGNIPFRLIWSKIQNFQFKLKFGT